MIETPLKSTPSYVMDDVLARRFTAEAAHDRPGILATLTDDAEHEPMRFLRSALRRARAAGHPVDPMAPRTKLAPRSVA